MRRISYAGTSYFTGNAIADAVIELAESLARRRRVELVEFRVRLRDGTTGSARVLLGDGMPIGCEPVAFDVIAEEEVVDADGVGAYRRRAAADPSPPAVPVTAGALQFYDDAFGV